MSLQDHLKLPWGPPILPFNKYWDSFTKVYRPVPDCVNTSNKCRGLGMSRATNQRHLCVFVAWTWTKLPIPTYTVPTSIQNPSWVIMFQKAMFILDITRNTQRK